MNILVSKKKIDKPTFGKNDFIRLGRVPIVILLGPKYISTNIAFDFAS